MNELIDDLGLVYPVKKQATPPRPARKLPELIDDMGLLQQTTQQPEAPELPPDPSYMQGLAAAGRTFLPNMQKEGVGLARYFFPADPKGFYGKKLDEWQNTAQQKIDENTLQIRDPLKRGVIGAATSFANQAPGYIASAIIKNPMPAITKIMGGELGRQEADRYARGDDSWKGHLNKYIQTGSEGLTELSPVKSFMKPLSKYGTHFAKAFGRKLVDMQYKENVGEAINTVVQKMSNAFLTDPNMDIKTALSELPTDLRDTAIATSIQTLGMGGLSAGLTRGKDLTEPPPPPPGTKDTAKGGEGLDLDKEGFSYENAELNKIWDAEYKATQQAQPKINETGKQEVILPEGDTAGHEKPELVDDLGILNTQAQPERYPKGTYYKDYPREIVSAIEDRVVVANQIGKINDAEMYETLRSGIWNPKIGDFEKAKHTGVIAKIESYENTLSDKIHKVGGKESVKPLYKKLREARESMPADEYLGKLIALDSHLQDKGLGVLAETGVKLPIEDIFGEQAGKEEAQQEVTKPELVDDMGILYRGQPVPEPQKASNSDIVDNILLGKGIFTTTSEDVAKGYGKHILKYKKPKPSEKVLDLSATSPHELKGLGLSDMTIASYEIAINDGNTRSAEDIFVEGLANKYLPDDITWNMVKGGTPEAIAIGITPDIIREKIISDLQQRGYTWWKYAGGNRAGGKGKHDVYVAMSEQDMETLVDDMGILDATARQPAQMQSGKQQPAAAPIAGPTIPIFPNIYEEIRKKVSNHILITPELLAYFGKDKKEIIKGINQRGRGILSNSKGIKFDVVAQELGITGDELVERLQYDQTKKEQRAQAQSDIAAYEHSRDWVNVGDLGLKPGATFKIENELFTVKGWDEEGNLVIKDGETYVVDEFGGKIPEPDEGSIKMPRKKKTVLSGELFKDTDISGNPIIQQTKEPGGVYEAEADAFTSQQVQTGEGEDIPRRQVGTQEEAGVPGSKGITYADVMKKSADRPIWVVYKKDGEEIGRVKTTTANTKEYKQKMGDIGATEIALEEVAYPDKGLPEAPLRMMPTIGSPYPEVQERFVGVKEDINPYDSKIDDALIADRIDPKIPKKELIRYGKERGVTIRDSTKTENAHLMLRKHLIDNQRGYDVAGNTPKLTDAEYLQRAKERSKNQKPLEYRHAGLDIPGMFKQVANSVVGKKWRNFWNIFSTLPGKEEFQDLRNDTIGRLWYDSQKINKLAGRLKAMPMQSREDMMAVIRGEKDNSILDKEQQELAKYIREQADAIGEAAVKRGMMKQSTYDAGKGTYMHIMYFRHLLDEIDTGSSGSTKMGRQNYLKGRMDPVIKEVKNADGSIGYKIYTKGGKPYPKNPYWDEQKGKPKWKAEQYATMEEAEVAKAKIEKKVALRRKELGEVKDIAVVAPTYFADALGDITMYDLFKSIAINPEWAWEKSSTTIEGKTYSIGMLQDEIEMQRQTFGVTQSPESLQRLQRLEAKYHELQEAAASATETGEIDKREWKQMPISKRYGALSGVYVRLEIARDILAVFDVAEPELSSMYSNMKKVFPAAMTAFKIGKVAVNIPSFPRNFVSGGIQVNMSGVPFYKLFGLVVKTVHALATKNNYYWAAGRKGLFRSSMSDVEINEMRNIMEQWKPKKYNIAGFVQMAKDLSRYYGKIDGFWKLAKYIEQVESGESPETAAREAQKWGMDYSTAHPSVKWARRSLVPFGSYQYKIAPLLVESLYKRPWVIAKYMAIPYILTEIAKQSLDLTDDEWETLKKAYPSWIRRSLTVFPLPWRDEQGNLQIIDIGAFFPWQNMQALALGLYRMAGGDTEGMGEAIHSLGLGNPMLDMFELSRRLSGDRPPADAYTGQGVFNANDSATMKAIKVSLYITNKFTPTFLNEEYGFAGKMYEAATGRDVYGGKDRYGRKVTFPQAASRLVGLNINPTTKKQGYAEKQAKAMHVDMELAKMRRDGIGGKRFENARKTAAEKKRRIYEAKDGGNPVKDLLNYAEKLYSN